MVVLALTLSVNVGTSERPAAAASSSLSADESIIFNFQGGGDGGFPYGGLIADREHALYGVAARAGAYNSGVVFKLTPSSSGYVETVLYTFVGGKDGAVPLGTLLARPSGTLYGTTYWGGSTGCFLQQGCGTVFKLTPTPSGYSESIIYRFQGGADGLAPQGGVIADSAGNLYGTTTGGGVDKEGTVFEIALSGWNDSECSKPAVAGKICKTPREIQLYSFRGGTDGAQPQAGLTLRKGLTLLGTTRYGGSTTYGAYGTVFEMTRAAGGYREQIVYRFQGGTDGSQPYSGLFEDHNGILFGTTESGAQDGVVYSLTEGASGWVERVLYRFQGGNDGAGPMGAVVEDAAGNLYGTTTEGGAQNEGTVFALVPSGSSYFESVLHTFSGPPYDGAIPYATPLLTADGSTLFGTTFNAGNGPCNSMFKGCGTVFTLNVVEMGHSRG